MKATLLCMIQIDFTQEEKDAVIAEAHRRQSENEKRNVKGRNGGLEKGEGALRLHMIGAAGEMAVAKYLNLKEHLYQELIPVKGSCDLPFNIDVKTRTKKWHSLIVQADDVSTKNYWLVNIENKIITIVGWLPHSECIKKQYYKDPAGGRPAYFVPQSKLNDPENWKV